MALTRFEERRRYSQLLCHFIIYFMHQWLGLELSRELGKYDGQLESGVIWKPLGSNPPQVDPQWFMYKDNNNLLQAVDILPFFREHREQPNHQSDCIILQTMDRLNFFISNDKLVHLIWICKALNLFKMSIHFNFMLWQSCGQSLIRSYPKNHLVRVRKTWLKIMN